ncbi:signal peptidase II [Sulfurovum sp. zt1-1]|uniref:Lipoprotein signal peptidase n=1 Tax=Sulfurovum zhangzhouensis TaxID=3019067 RepID=A0ABT7R024_9BACT|nr:signal peptidase II [Sulfurovum zhangzhouensis]MDM5272441.1 signal peptidase II [Sulfurovum zhangzhouensis]
MRGIFIFLLAAIGTFLIDQSIKSIFIEGYYREGSCIDLALHYNKGVAFSLFAFLGPYLKWIQVVLIMGIIAFVIKEGYMKRYAFPVGLVIGGAIGNLYDRFVHDGVVDYVAWHCGFEFAVFNYADVAIDIGIVWMLVMIYFFPKKSRIK